MKMWYLKQLKHCFDAYEYPVSAMVALETWKDVAEHLKRNGELYTFHWTL